MLSDFSDDYIDSSFNIEYSMDKIGFKTNLIIVKINLKDEIIERMIKEEKAILAVHLECSRTSYRCLFKFKRDERKLQITIDSTKMVDRVELSGVVIINEKIKKYKNPKINKDFYGEKYIISNLEEGDLIGATVTQVLDIPMKKNDFENISSIINVGISKDNFMSVDYDDEIIIIKLPEKEYERYYRLSNTVYSTVIMTSTILPSLIHVLDMISSEEEQFDSQLTWYKVIEAKLSLKDLSIEDINEKIWRTYGDF